MTRRFGLSVLLAGLAVALTTRVTPSVTAAAPAETLRTVYFSAIDNKGAAITDLTAADLTVKEGGKEQKIASVQLATGPMHIAIVVDDRGTGGFQNALVQFLQATFGKNQIAINALNPQSLRLTAFTTEADALRTALGRLGQRGKIDIDGEQIVEAVRQACKDLVAAKATRPVILVMTASGETALSDRATDVMNELKASGASLNVVYITGLELGKVLGDGPKQSGGVIEPAAGSVAVGPALARITDSLLHQYALTYSLPDGVKPNERLQVATSRKGITVVAPTRIPDK